MDAERPAGGDASGEPLPLLPHNELPADEQGRRGDDEVAWALRVSRTAAADRAPDERRKPLEVLADEVRRLRAHRCPTLNLGHGDEGLRVELEDDDVGALAERPTGGDRDQLVAAMSAAIRGRLANLPGIEDAPLDRVITEASRAAADVADLVAEVREIADTWPREDER